MRGLTLKCQSRNEVCFYIADPIFISKFLITDSKSKTHFGPWSHKNGTSWSLIPQKTADPKPMACDPWSLKKLLIPNPWLVIPDPSKNCWSLSHGLWSLIPQKTADPEPMACDPWSLKKLLIPIPWLVIPDPSKNCWSLSRGLWSLIPQKTADPYPVACDPWSLKKLLIPIPWLVIPDPSKNCWSLSRGLWSLIPQKTADPYPVACDPWSRGCDPRSPLLMDLRSHIPCYDPENTFEPLDLLSDYPCQERWSHSRAGRLWEV